MGVVGGEGADRIGFARSAGGKDVGGAVWILPPGGVGGTSGTLCSGITGSEAGVAGV